VSLPKYAPAAGTCAERPPRAVPRSSAGPVAAQSVRLARRVVPTVCRILRVPSVGEDAALVVSELVGNSVRAGYGETNLLRLHWTLRRLRIEIHDAAPGQPRCVHAEPTAESGRGMSIVSPLAVRWGVTRQRPGKVVWAEIALPCIG
jgi:anti-sigma regulatory factor (Ser/Thr protein kinase)